MDFIRNLLGLPPVYRTFNNVEYIPGPNSPYTPREENKKMVEEDRHEPTRADEERKIRSMLRAPDPAERARGRQMREDLYTNDSNAAVASFRAAMRNARVGPAIAAFTRLCIAEEKLRGSVDKSFVFGPGGEGRRLGRALLQRLGSIHCDGWNYLQSQRARNAFALCLDDSVKTREALQMLTLYALAHDRQGGHTVLRWCLDMQRISPPPAVPPETTVLCYEVAKILAPSLPDLSLRWVRRAEAAWERGEIASAFNYLRPMAALASVTEPMAKAAVRQATGGSWPQATRLAHRILEEKTLDSEAVDAFRLTPSSAGWTSIVPLLDPLTEEGANALERLMTYVGNSYLGEDWQRRKAVPLLKAVVKTMEEQGFGERPCIAGAKKTMELRWYRGEPGEDVKVEEPMPHPELPFWSVDD